MTIYIVTNGEYSDYHICSVFSTREKAQIFIDSFKKGWSDFEIEEWEMDNYEINLGMKVYIVRIQKDGTIIEISHSDSSYSLDDFCDYDMQRNMYIKCFARDEEHAQKIAGERRAIVLGTCGWGNIPSK